MDKKIFTDFEYGKHGFRESSVQARMLDNSFKCILKSFQELFTENRAIRKRLNELEGHKQVTLETIGVGVCKECEEKTNLYNHNNNILCGSCCCLTKYNIK